MRRPTCMGLPASKGRHLKMPMIMRVACPAALRYSVLGQQPGLSRLFPSVSELLEEYYGRMQVSRVQAIWTGRRGG